MTQQTPQSGSRRTKTRKGCNRELRRLIAAIEAAGGQVDPPTRGGHHKVYYQGQLITTLASTPSEYRGRKNDIANLRRAGLRLTTKGTYEP